MVRADRSKPKSQRSRRVRENLTKPEIVAKAAAAAGSVERDLNATLRALAKTNPELVARALDCLLSTDEAEREEALAALTRLQDRRRPVPIKATPNERGSIDTAMTVDDPGNVIYTARLSEAMGTRSWPWASHLLRQLVNVGAEGEGGKAAADGTDAAIAFMNGLAPRDEVEAALGAQMFAAHNLAMSMARRAEKVESLEWIKLCADQANKASRTFTAQVEALAKLRNAGKQVVEVVHVHKHVYVAPGGQAIVGDVHNSAPGGGAATGSESQPHGYAGEPRLPFAQGAAVWSTEQTGQPMSGAGDAREPALLPARRSEGVGGTEGTAERGLERRGLVAGGDGAQARDAGTSQGLEGPAGEAVLALIAGPGHD